MQPGDEAAGLGVDVGQPDPVGGIGEHVADLLGLAGPPSAKRPQDQVRSQQLINRPEHRPPGTQRESDDTLFVRRTVLGGRVAFLGRSVAH